MSEKTPQDQSAAPASPTDRVDADRRAFLNKAAGAVPPAMVMLLSTSMASSAIAQSGAIVGGTGGGDSDNGFLGPLAALLGLGVTGASAKAATQGGGAFLAAAPPAPAPAAPAAPLFGVPAASAPAPAPAKRAAPTPAVLRRGERG